MPSDIYYAILLSFYWAIVSYFYVNGHLLTIIDNNYILFEYD